MLDLSLLPDGGTSWLDASGEHADIVLSTRIRLARNLAKFPFPNRADDSVRSEIEALLRDENRILPVSSLTENGLVSTRVPGPIWPWLSAAFSA